MSNRNEQPDRSSIPQHAASVLAVRRRLHRRLAIETRFSRRRLRGYESRPASCGMFSPIYGTPSCSP
ncbi:MAG: hypothetical protein ACLTMP_08250 [Eggerthella lenta]